MIVLVVEDNNISNKIMMRLLERIGECQSVTDGEAAVAIVKESIENQNPFDLMNQLRELERQCHDAGFSLDRAYSASLFAILWSGSEKEVEYHEAANTRRSEALEVARALHQALGNWLRKISVTKEQRHENGR